MKSIFVIFTAITIITFGSCQTLSSKEKKDTAAPSLKEDSDKDIRKVVPKQTETKEPEPTIERKIIKEGDIRFETSNINETKSLISKTVEEYKGYISNDNIRDFSNTSEYSLTIRIPSDKFDALLNKISENAERLVNKNIQVLDVTEEFIDIEARIRTKKELEGRYLALLKQAKKVDEMLNIESEIGELQTEIESTQGRMNYLKDRIAFSTLTVTFYKKASTSFGFTSKFADAIKSGWDVFLWFLIGLTHFWIFILLGLISVFFIIRRRRKNN